MKIPPTKHPKILIVNVHSALNLGDEGIMQATLQGLLARFPQAQISVAANDAPSWAGRGPFVVVDSLATWFGDPALGRWRRFLWAAPLYLPLLALAALLYRGLGWPWRLGDHRQRALLNAYYQADLVVSCGGGNFYAAHALSPGFLTGLLTLGFALALGKRVVMLPQSLGPITGRLQTALARLVFARIETVMVREPRSQSVARRQLGLSSNQENNQENANQLNKVILLPDLALALPPVRPAPLGPGLKIGLTPMDRGAQRQGFAGQTHYEEALLALACRLHREMGATLYLFCQCTGPSPDQDDRRIAHRLHRRLAEAGVAAVVLEEFADAYALKSAYAAMDCVVGTRMHAAIFSLSSGVPTVLIGYQPKSCGLMELLGLADLCVPIEAANAEALYEHVTGLLADLPAARARVAERVEAAQQVLAGWPRYLEPQP